jgi:hypothetical protein
MERSLRVPVVDSEQLFRLSHTLLNLRDRLSFEDQKWFEDITSEIVSIDSAASALEEGDPTAIIARDVFHAAVARVRVLLSQARSIAR